MSPTTTTKTYQHMGLHLLQPVSQRYICSVVGSELSVKEINTTTNVSKYLMDD